MRKISDLLYDDWGSPTKGTYPLPCLGIENLTYDYSEKIGLDSRPDSRFMVMVHFPNRKYRQITHVQEYGIESLVGNIGGYIGLFLGYSLLHFPTFVMKLCITIKRKLVRPRVQEIRHTRRKKTQQIKTELCIRLNDALGHEQRNDRMIAHVGGIQNQLNVISQRINEVESKLRRSQEGVRPSSKPTTSNNSMERVRVTAWYSSVAKTPDYI